MPKSSSKEDIEFWEWNWSSLYVLQRKLWGEDARSRSYGKI